MAERITTRHERTTDKNDRTSDKPHDMLPDLVGVKSRVSWSAIIAGTVIALACFMSLSLLFAALGITMTDAGVRDRAIGIGALVAAIFTLIVSLFVGGWVAAQMTVGENRQEAVVYGLLTWGAVTIASLAMVAMGIRVGYFAAVGGSVIVQNNERIPNWEQAALQSNFTQEQVNQMKAAVSPNKIVGDPNDPANQVRVRENAMYAAWIALVGMLLSMAACIGGSMVGRGVAFHLYPVRVVRDERSQIIIPAT
jgi:hypothetical protein